MINKLTFSFCILINRDGLLKMKEVYESNASLGDPMTITGQLTDSYTRIEKLKTELERYQSMLEDAENEPHQLSATLPAGSVSSGGGPGTPNASSLGRHVSSAAMISSSAQHNGTGGGVGGSSNSPRSSLASHRTSLSDESLSRSASDSSVCTNPSQPIPVPPPINTSSSHIPTPPPMSSTPTSNRTSSVITSPISTSTPNHNLANNRSTTPGQNNSSTVPVLPSSGSSPRCWAPASSTTTSTTTTATTTQLPPSQGLVTVMLPVGGANNLFSFSHLLAN